VKLGPLLAGIVAVAALIFAALWWRATPEPAARDGAAPRGAARVDAAPVAAPVGAPATSAPTTAPTPAIPVARMARSEIAGHFRGMKVPPAAMDALVAGRADEAARLLEASGEPDAIVALSKLPGLCAASLGSSTLQSGDVRTYTDGDPGPATVAALEGTIAAQRDWAKRFVQGCEAAGLTRDSNGSMRDADLRGRIVDKLRRCADAGSGNCLTRLADLDRTEPAKRLSRLQAAALLGSTDAQEQLLAFLEQGPRADAPENQQAARFWREALAKSNPEYRASFLGCYDRNCDPQRLDRTQVRRELETAAREGSLTALIRLGVTERNVGDAMAREGVAVDTTRVPTANPSEPDAYAWRAVTERLAMQGCLGFWPTWASFVGSSAAAARELRPSQLDEARRLTDEYWQDVGRGIAAQRGCAEQANGGP
jgi:hypothetical protein